MATPKFGLETIAEGQFNADVTFNANMIILEIVGNWSALDYTNDPPSSPSEGDQVIVNGTPTGVFVGHEEELAGFYNGAWIFVSTTLGMMKHIDDENQWRYYDASVWTVVGTEALLPWD